MQKWILGDAVHTWLCSLTGSPASPQLRDPAPRACLAWLEPARVRICDPTLCVDGAVFQSSTGAGCPCINSTHWGAFPEPHLTPTVWDLRLLHLRAESRVVTAVRGSRAREGPRLLEETRVPRADGASPSPPPGPGAHGHPGHRHGCRPAGQ